MDAGDKYVLLALIFPEKKGKLEVTDGLPSVTLLLASDLGLITKILFVD
jgi:hypothetical protein